MACCRVWTRSSRLTFTSRAALRARKTFYALLKLQDKIDTMTLARKPTEVRLDPNMVENFKRQVMIAQTLQPK